MDAHKGMKRKTVVFYLFHIYYSLREFAFFRIQEIQLHHLFLIIFIPIITMSLEIFLSFLFNKKFPVFFIGFNNYNMSYFIAVIFMTIAEEYIF